MKTLIKWLSSNGGALIALGVMIVLSACGGGTSTSQLNVGSGQLLILFPASLSKHVTDGMVIKANLTVDNRDVYALNVFPQQKLVTGKINSISRGRHTLVVEYLIVEQGVDVSIARGTILIDVGDRELLDIDYQAFIYSDDDADGITNIAELEMGTNYLDTLSVPASHGLHGSSLYAIKDKMIGDNAVLGTVASPKYNMK
ncbi:MAG: hypothetical protein OEZ43_20110 [Gammaproteobacteria bacterium]|nr:hypothetical protein [Gammaproteobacteria bacterium]